MSTVILRLPPPDRHRRSRGGRADGRLNWQLLNGKGSGELLRRGRLDAGREAFVVVALPVGGRLLGGEDDSPQPLHIAGTDDAWRHQAHWKAVVGRNWSAVHFIGEEELVLRV